MFWCNIYVWIKINFEENLIKSHEDFVVNKENHCKSDSPNSSPSHASIVKLMKIFAISMNGFKLKSCPNLKLCPNLTLLINMELGWA